MDPHVWCKIVYIRIWKIGDIYLYWIALIWLFQPNNYRNCIQTHSYMMEPSDWIYCYLCVRIEVDCGPMKIAFSIQIAVWMADEFRVLLKSHRRTHTHTSTHNHVDFMPNRSIVRDKSQWHGKCVFYHSIPFKKQLYFVTYSKILLFSAMRTAGLMYTNQMKACIQTKRHIDYQQNSRTQFSSIESESDSINATIRMANQHMATVGARFFNKMTWIGLHSNLISTGNCQYCTKSFFTWSIYSNKKKPFNLSARLNLFCPPNSIV